MPNLYAGFRRKIISTGPAIWRNGLQGRQVRLTFGRKRLFEKYLAGFLED